MEMKVLSWLHISDIHVGHGSKEDQLDQSIILDRIRADAVSVIRRGAPYPDAIFITGDISFSGQAIEYNLATSKINELVNKLSENIGKNNPGISLYAVPGNHDVDREICNNNEKDDALLHRVRDGHADVSYVLNDEMTKSRFSGYLDFSRILKEPCREKLFWREEINIKSKGQNIRIGLVGLNTALLSQDDNDEGELKLGKSQEALFYEAKHNSDLLIALSHHPLDCVSDSKFLVNSDIHLSGHVHNLDSFVSYSGDEENLRIGLVGGASHLLGKKRSYAYSIGALYLGADRNSLELRVWPRRYYPKKVKFLVDIESIGQDKFFSEFKIALSNRVFPSKAIEVKVNKEVLQVLKRKRLADPGSLADEVTDVMNSSWQGAGEDDAHTFVTRELKRIRSDHKINRVYAIDHFNPAIWAEPAAYYWLSIPAREYIKKNYKFESKSWNITFTNKVYSAIKRATQNVSKVMGAEDYSLISPFDDVSLDDCKPGVPEYEVVRILVWKPEWLEKAWVQYLITSHNAFNIPLFFVDQDWARARISLEREYLLLCRKDDEETTDPQRIGGSLWDENKPIGNMSGLGEHPITHFRLLLDTPKILFADDALKLFKQGELSRFL
ncbi:MAG: hypothetical protein Tsb002_30870 [Wenzhouxiangellaceae bacterium]